MAVSMTQGKVCAKHSGSVTFWAWTASIAVHLIVLSAFGVIRFSRFTTQDKQRPAPIAKVSQIKKLVQAASIIPKPKIKKALPATSRDRFARRADRVLPAKEIFGTAKPGFQNSGNFSKPSVSRSGIFTGSGILPEGIEFFGSWTQERKVCYLVDCSGSMQGIFGQVRKKLKESIQGLQPDQYFYIIFFGNNRLFEFGNGRLIRATQKAKSAAYDFIDSARPAGQTNAMAALERTVQIRDGYGSSPSIVYFLTDGFELTNEEAQRFSQKIANLLRRFAPTTRINTIGFWPAREDSKMLETIARQSGGEFVLVTDKNK